MVWRSVILLAVLAALVVVPLDVSAATVYDGNISSTYAGIFEDIAGKLPVGDDYVFYRSGQYEYTMIAGEITWDGSTFRADEAASYVLVTNSGSYSTYQYSTGTVTAWELTPGAALVYSSLGNYPGLIDGSTTYSFACLVLLFVMLLMSLIRPIFSFTYRRRSR